MSVSQRGSARPPPAPGLLRTALRPWGPGLSRLLFWVVTHSLDAHGQKKEEGGIRPRVRWCFTASWQGSGSGGKRSAREPERQGQSFPSRWRCATRGRPLPRPQPEKTALARILTTPTHATHATHPARNTAHVSGRARERAPCLVELPPCVEPAALIRYDTRAHSVRACLPIQADGSPRVLSRIP